MVGVRGNGLRDHGGENIAVAAGEESDCDL